MSQNEIFFALQSLFHLGQELILKIVRAPRYTWSELYVNVRTNIQKKERSVHLAVDKDNLVAY